MSTSTFSLVVGKARHVVNGTSQARLLSDVPRRCLYMCDLVAIRAHRSLSRGVLFRPAAVALLDETRRRSHWIHW